MRIALLLLLCSCGPLTVPAPDLGCAQIACGQDEVCSSLCPGTVCVGGFCAANSSKKLKSSK